MSPRWIPHALVLAAAGGAAACARDALPEQPESPSDVEYSTRAAAARAGGDLETALTLATRALVLRLARHGPSHPDVARSFLQLGDLRLEKGQAAWARQSYLRALEVLDAGPDDHDLRRTLRGRLDALALD